jgi:hypothetical protein
MKIFIFFIGLIIFFGNTFGCIASIQRLKEKDTLLQELLIALNILGVFIGACILRGYIK